MKKLILMAIFTHFLINYTYAYREYNWYGWDSKSWPSYKIGKTRFRDPNDYVVLSTNNPLFIHAYKIVVSQDFSVSYPLPTYNSTNSTVFIRAMPYGWRREIGAYDNPFEGMTFRVKNSNDYYNVITGYYYMAFGTNYGSSMDIDSICASWHKIGWGDLSHYKIGCWPVSYYYEEQFTSAGVVSTNLVLDATGVRILDTYNAVWFLSKICSANSDYDYILPPLLTFYNEHYALHNIKTAIKEDFINRVSQPSYETIFPSSTQGFVVATSASALWDTQYAGYTNSIAINPTNHILFLQHLNLPTNYFEYTPYRNVSGSSWGIPHLLTNECMIRTSSSGIVTQQFTDYLGQTHYFAGTNNQVFTFVITNNNIQENFTSADYGWKHIPILISNMHYIAYPSYAEAAYFDNTKTPIYCGYGYSTNSWAEAIANATKNFAPTNYLYISKDYGDGIGVRYLIYPYTPSNDWYLHTTYALSKKQYNSSGGNHYSIEFRKRACDSIIAYVGDLFTNSLTNYSVQADVYLVAQLMPPYATNYNNDTYDYTNSCWNILQPNKPALIIDKRTVIFSNIIDYLEFTNVFNQYNNNIPYVGTLPTNSSLYSYYSGWNIGVDGATWNHQLIIDWQHAWRNVITE